MLPDLVEPILEGHEKARNEPLVGVAISVVEAKDALHAGPTVEQRLGKRIGRHEEATAPR